jgi:transcriptional regulator with XRE-family HTH domain
MRDVDLGRVLRALRRRRGWRQEDAANRAGVHRSTWSLVERGHVDHLTFATVRRCLEAIEVKLDLQPRWRGAELDRLLDEGHATLQAAWKGRLEAWDWAVVAEASFNQYGDRGRIDLLAWHPVAQRLAVIEIKTELADAQNLLGALDVKVRVAPRVANSLGWPRPARVVPILIVRNSTTARDRIARLAPLFTSFAWRGRKGVSWLRRPLGDCSGVLIFSDLRGANGGRATRVGGHRVRLRRDRSSVDGARPRAADGSESA